MLGRFKERYCPVCGSAESSEAITPRLSAEALSDSELRNHWAGFFKEKSFFSYRRCARCSLLYCPLFFGEEQLQSLYAAMGDNTAGVPITILRRTQRGYFDILKRFSPLVGSYLEIGADIGLFTNFCVDEGHFTKFWLFEPNQQVWATLHQKLERHEHEIIPEMFSYNAVPSRSVDVAVMVHVLDHLIDPREMLTQLRRTLKPQSRLLIVTHDESSLLAQLAKDRWPAYCLQHPQLFRPSSISALLQECGFEVVKITKTRNHFPADFLLRHFFWMFGLRFPEIHALESFPLALKLGNMATIATPNHAS